MLVQLPIADLTLAGGGTPTANQTKQGYNLNDKLSMHSTEIETEKIYLPKSRYRGTTRLSY